MKNKNKDDTPLVDDITTNTFSSGSQEEESFHRPKPKDFTVQLEFYSNKPNKITYDSRDNISDDKDNK